MKIALIDYNAGNTQSVLSALKRLGYNATVTADEKQLRRADKIIFPGVGHAASAMQSLQQKGLDQIIPGLRQPLLGICVGMQLLCSHSEEGNTVGLGIIETAVKKFPGSAGYKVPQVGWNLLQNKDALLLKGVDSLAYVYYVHSYYVETCAATVAVSEYVLPYSAMLQERNFFGVQFHAEKSAGVGDKILLNFLNL